MCVDGKGICDLSCRSHTHQTGTVRNASRNDFLSDSRSFYKNHTAKGPLTVHTAVLSQRASRRERELGEASRENIRNTGQTDLAGNGSQNSVAVRFCSSRNGRISIPRHTRGRPLPCWSKIKDAGASGGDVPGNSCHTSQNGT